MMEKMAQTKVIRGLQKWEASASRVATMEGGVITSFVV